MKFRWTRELLAEKKKRELRRRLPESGGMGYETMAQYFSRMRRREAGRAAQAVQIAAELDARPRPLKPPSRRSPL